MFYRFIMLSTLCGFLSGCSWLGLPNPFTNHNDDYLKAKSTPPLYIPPGLTSDQFHNDYPIPNRPYTLTEANISLLPPDLR